jgi:hypothetical protein
VLQGTFGTRTRASANAFPKTAQPTNNGTPRNANVVEDALLPSVHRVVHGAQANANASATRTKFALVEVESIPIPVGATAYLKSAPQALLLTP